MGLRRRWVLGLIGSAWIVMVAGGLLLLMRYQMTPGAAQASTQARGFESPHFEPSQAQHSHTLVMFLHPQCACSHATIEELNRLMTHAHDQLRATLYVLQPSQQPEGWCHTSLWTEAQAIPGVEVRGDRDGIIAQHFAAHTSGETFLYDRAGRLRFAGGITGSRGHAGDNAGVDAILRCVQQPAVASAATDAIARTPTFGCALQNSTSSRSSHSMEGVEP
jgi:hypothetical protein